MGQRTGHVECLPFELGNQGVEFSAFLGSERPVIALGKQCRHTFALVRRHAKRAALALRCRPRLCGSREALEVFQQLPMLWFWQLDERIAQLFKREFHSGHRKPHGKAFVWDTTHTRLAKIRAQWQRLRNRADALAALRDLTANELYGRIPKKSTDS